MKTKNRTITTTELLFFTMVSTQIFANENTLEISELCRSSNDSGIKVLLNYVLADKSASNSEIVCQQRLNKTSEEAILEATYSTDKMSDSSFRAAQGVVKNRTQYQFKSASTKVEQLYSNMSDRKASTALPTPEGYQTLPQ